MKNDDSGDAPLVGTLRFVFIMGISFAILWFVLFALLARRW